MVAASAGNHAQGVAFAAALLGAKATVVMPEGAPLPKIAATRSYGAEIILHGARVEDALARARELADEQGSVFIHPFEHPDIIAGQGTVGLEIVEQCPRGAHDRGAGRRRRPGRRDRHRGEGHRPGDPGDRRAGRAVAPYPGVASRPAIRCRSTPAPTMADGIAVAQPGELAFGILAELAERVVTVSEEACPARCCSAWNGPSRSWSRPARPASPRCSMHPRCAEPPVVVVLSGGNIDPLLLAKVLRHGLSAAGRYLTFRCRLPDRPGALATLLAELAGLGANVLDVVHARFTPHLRVDEVEVQLQVETRGPGHCDEVIGQLRKSGYTLIFS